MERGSSSGATRSLRNVWMRARLEDPGRRSSRRASSAKSICQAKIAANLDETNRARATVTNVRETPLGEIIVFEIAEIFDYRFLKVGFLAASRRLGQGIEALLNIF